ncbi:Uncharacterized protein TCM_044413 [Theobroma cacao]|uniref:Uncharacterized protein n=1 Tax=Theobroma cacao TaxID=3641 RepID=A0A061FR07_THECC|nr:Uncharacterized protein TCM_044413 [Theobroma cacao]
MGTQDRVNDCINVISLDNERIFKKLYQIVPKQISDVTSKQNFDDKVISSQGVKIKFRACYLPKDNELKPLEEDVCFICYEEQTLVVADEHMLKGSVDLGKVKLTSISRLKDYRRPVFSSLCGEQWVHDV